MRESDVAKHLTRRVENYGGVVWKVSSTSPRGVPGYVVLLHGGITVWVEIPTVSRTLCAQAENRHIELWQRGHRVVMLDTREAVDHFMETL
jgi:hypothetical protein